MFWKFTARRKTSAYHNALAQTTQRFLTLQDAVPKFPSPTSLLFLSSTARRSHRMVPTTNLQLCPSPSDVATILSSETSYRGGP